MRSWSIRNQLMIWILGVVGALWTISALTSATFVQTEVDELFDAALNEAAVQIAPFAQMEPTGDRYDATFLDPLRDLMHHRHLYYQVVAADGTLLSRSDTAPNEALQVPLRLGYSNIPSGRVFTHNISGTDQWLHVAQDIEERQEAILGFTLSVFLPLIVLLPILAGAILWLISKATAPIENIRSQLQKKRGEDLCPIKPDGLPEELISIITDVNAMMGRLKTAIEAEKTYAANAAHELRNPVAAVSAQAEVLTAELEGTASQERAKKMGQELKRLGRQVEKMLELARAEAGLGATPERVDLLVISRLLMSDYQRSQSSSNRVHVSYPTSTYLPVHMDSDAVAIVIRNAIDNALVHSKAGSRVDVTITDEGLVTVSNDFSSTTHLDIDELKRRFQRGDGRPRTGFGLGLSIMDTLMRQAGGNLEISAEKQNADVNQFKLILQFPKAD
jgi:two-component system, OmpR family, sensor kinase